VSKGKKPKPPPLPTLDEQLRAHDAAEPVGIDTTKRPDGERMEWARKRLDLTDAIRRRDSKRLADPGREGSNFGVSPYAERGHVVENAPQELRISKDSAYPKRITTQRVIDRYLKYKLIDQRQWKAADRLWQIWFNTGKGSRLAAGYSPMFVDSATDPEAAVVGHSGAVKEWAEVMVAVSGFYSCLVHVVVMDGTAGDWARIDRGKVGRKAESVGIFTLQLALDTLAKHFKY
jgi:hypothetical protein